ncbi:hypothetical protein MDPP_00195 [Candidatus Phytoplasma pini]|uniref:Uncharacterized protein n=1 Tax=Candidatus Phytoplasma pini TaxID=267362 RepID=A0A559KJK0_9MOLU|nr:hypothetical protein MDPP_00195 [Candidatus Phytoplasma pini]
MREVINIKKSKKSTHLSRFCVQKRILDKKILFIKIFHDFNIKDLFFQYLFKYYNFKDNYQGIKINAHQNSKIF